MSGGKMIEPKPYQFEICWNGSAEKAPDSSFMVVDFGGSMPIRPSSAHVFKDEGFCHIEFESCSDESNARKGLDSLSDYQHIYAFIDIDPIENRDHWQVKMLSEDPRVKAVFVNREWDPFQKLRINETEFLAGRNGTRLVQFDGDMIWTEWRSFGKGWKFPEKYDREPWRSIIERNRRKTLQPKSYRWPRQKALFGLFDMMDYIAEHSEKSLADMEGVEIGSYQGSSAEVFASVLDGLVTIDPWEYGGKKLVEAEAIYRKTMSSFNNVSHMKMPGSLAADGFYPGRFDFIYIDAIHEYQNVVDDINTWLPKLKPDGWLCGHDFKGTRGNVERALIDTVGLPDKVFSEKSWAVQFKDGKRVAPWL